MRSIPIAAIHCAVLGRCTMIASPNAKPEASAMANVFAPTGNIIIYKLPVAFPHLSQGWSAFKHKSMCAVLFPLQSIPCHLHPRLHRAVQRHLPESARFRQCDISTFEQQGPPKSIGVQCAVQKPHQLPLVIALCRLLRAVVGRSIPLAHLQSHTTTHIATV